jgi:hypothetical protein
MKFELIIFAPIPYYITTYSMMRNDKFNHLINILTYVYQCLIVFLYFF